jgi:hypothetical protein
VYKVQVLLVATNFPLELDSAIRRRFTPLFVGLPDQADRVDLLRFFLSKVPNEVTEADVLAIARSTDRFSGSDINLLVKNALQGPMRELLDATHFQKDESTGKWSPCDPTTPGAVQKTLMDADIADDGLNPARLVRASDIINALERTHPALTVKEYRRFLDQRVEMEGDLSTAVADSDSGSLVRAEMLTPLDRELLDVFVPYLAATPGAPRLSPVTEWIHYTNRFFVAVSRGPTAPLASEFEMFRHFFLGGLVLMWSVLPVVVWILAAAVGLLVIASTSALPLMQIMHGFLHHDSDAEQVVQASVMQQRVMVQTLSLIVFSMFTAVSGSAPNFTGFRFIDVIVTAFMLLQLSDLMATVAGVPLFRYRHGTQRLVQTYEARNATNSPSPDSMSLPNGPQALLLGATAAVPIVAGAQSGLRHRASARDL